MSCPRAGWGPVSGSMTRHGRLMLTVLSGLTEFERSLIATRTGEDHERSKARAKLPTLEGLRKLRVQSVGQGATIAGDEQGTPRA
jgi:DNA invertase Pin-like site-specific DNA recombinase